MKVSYISACLDASGYAEAARNNIAALDKVGILVDVVPMSFEQFKSDLGILGNKIKSLVNSNSDAQIQIIHSTPPIFDKFKKNDKYNIGYTTWETTKLPSSWVNSINNMNEVWVPSTQNVEIFQDSGVNIPIYKIPHAFNRKLFEDEICDVMFQNKNSDDFTFYSIFQWTERKNPLAILKAYLTEFSSNEKVCLVLKTYLIDPTNIMEKEKIKSLISDIKDKLYLKQYPKILLIANLLSRGQIHAVHQSGDCYLSFHRNEGFGIPCIEAMMAGKPVIATNYGGTEDFIDNEVGYPVNYMLTPCFGMPWENYRGDMNWADINILDAKKKMRQAFNNREECKQKGEKAKAFVDNSLSWDAIGNLMKNRLEQIWETKFK